MYNKAWIAIVLLVLIVFYGCAKVDDNRDGLAEILLILDQINEEYGTNLKIATEEDLLKLESEGVGVTWPDYTDIDLIEFEKEMRKIAEKFVGFRSHGWNAD